MVVKQFVYPATGGGQSTKLLFSQGKFDWDTNFVPNIKKVWVSKDPEHNHYWFPGGATISIFFNVAKPPFNDVKFREAVAYAVDREAISQKAEYGYVEPASQIGMFLPGQKDWLDPSIPNQGYIKRDPDKANSILEGAGYKKQGGKLMDKNGKPISFTFEVQNGYTDWIQAAQIIQKNLSDLGMNVNITTPEPSTISEDQATGHFDAVFGVNGGSSNPYLNYYPLLYSAQTAPIGKRASSNVIRWKDDKTDKLLDQLRQTTDKKQQKQLTYQLEQIMVKQFPVIGLWYGATWGEYSTRYVTGWPSEDNPYALPAPYLQDALLILSHLKASSESGS